MPIYLIGIIKGCAMTRSRGLVYDYGPGFYESFGSSGICLCSVSYVVLLDLVPRSKALTKIIPSR